MRFRTWGEKRGFLRLHGCITCWGEEGHRDMRARRKTVALLAIGLWLVGVVWDRYRG